jgi:hypothetical protein
MQILNFAARGIDLHVLPDFVGKQMTVVGHKHNRLDTLIGQH